MKKFLNLAGSLMFLGLMGMMILGCNAQPTETEAETHFDFEPKIEVVDNPQNLNENLVFVEQRSQPNYRIAQFDPESQKISTLFEIPKGGWVYQLDVSADGTQVALAYSAPPENDQSLLDRSGIYLLDLAQVDAQPQLLVGSQQVDVYYAYPTWTSDGKFLYYEVSNTTDSKYFIERYNTETGEVLRIVDNAILPQPSPDGNSLTYFQIQPESEMRSLMLSDADGNNVQEIIPGYAYYDLDCPVFSADGQSIYFTVLEDPLASIHWIDQLFGTHVAYAHAKHNLPADWWQTSITDIRPKKITEQSIITHCGQFSNEGEHFGFASNEGIYVMSSGENEAHLILKSRAIPVFDWMP